MHTALDLRPSVTPAPARPVLVARNGDRLPLRPVAPVSELKRIVGQPDAQVPSPQERRPDEAILNETPHTAVALVRGTIAAPVSSSLFLAQLFAQEVHGEARLNKAEDEASFAAYSTAAERGTVFYGLEYPVDFSV